MSAPRPPVFVVNSTDVADIITRDCGYGFAGHAVLMDGSRVAYTGLHASREQAEAAVLEILADHARGVTP